MVASLGARLTVSLNTSMEGVEAEENLERVVSRLERAWRRA